MQEPLSTRTSPTRAREDGEDVLSVPDTQRLTTLFAAARLAWRFLTSSFLGGHFSSHLASNINIIASQLSCRKLTG